MNTNIKFIKEKTTKENLLVEPKRYSQCFLINQTIIRIFEDYVLIGHKKLNINVMHASRFESLLTLTTPGPTYILNFKNSKLHKISFDKLKTVIKTEYDGDILEVLYDDGVYEKLRVGDLEMNGPVEVKKDKEVSYFWRGSLVQKGNKVEDAKGNQLGEVIEVINLPYGNLLITKESFKLNGNEVENELEYGDDESKPFYYGVAAGDYLLITSSNNSNVFLFNKNLEIVEMEGKEFVYVQADENDNQLYFRGVDYDNGKLIAMDLKGTVVEYKVEGVTVKPCGNQSIMFDCVEVVIDEGKLTVRPYEGKEAEGLIKPTREIQKPLLSVSKELEKAELSSASEEDLSSIFNSHTRLEKPKEDEKSILASSSSIDKEEDSLKPITMPPNSSSFAPSSLDGPFRRTNEAPSTQSKSFLTSFALSTERSTVESMAQSTPTAVQSNATIHTNQPKLETVDDIISTILTIKPNKVQINNYKVSNTSNKIEKELMALKTQLKKADTVTREIENKLAVMKINLDVLKGIDTNHVEDSIRYFDEVLERKERLKTPLTYNRPLLEPNLKRVEAVNCNLKVTLSTDNVLTKINLEPIYLLEKIKLEYKEEESGQVVEPKKSPISQGVPTPIEPTPQSQPEPEPIQVPQPTLPQPALQHPALQQPTITPPSFTPPAFTPPPAESKSSDIFNRLISSPIPTMPKEDKREENKPPSAFSRFSNSHNLFK